MYSGAKNKVLQYIHQQGRGNAGVWFTAGDCARAMKISVPAARRHLRHFCAVYENLMDMTHEEYRPNLFVQLFRVWEVK